MSVELNTKNASINCGPSPTPSVISNKSEDHLLARNSNIGSKDSLLSGKHYFEKVTEIGEYNIVGKLGKGGAGTVFKGQHSVTEDFAAIKRIDLSGMHPKEKKQMEREIRLLSNLEHENIVKYLGTYNDGSSLDIILEYIDGGTLNAHAREQFDDDDTPEWQLVEWFDQVLNGLVYLHQKKIVHRDIKGENIMYCSDGTCKLTDFGSGKVLSQIQKTHSVVGTPYWMAPEIIQMSVEQSSACDIWSFACTLIEIRTGSPPFIDSNPMSALYKIVQCKSVPLPNNISEEFKDFFQKCFQKNPKNRATAKELLNHPWLQKDFSAEKQDSDIKEPKNRKTSNNKKKKEKKKKKKKEKQENMGEKKTEINSMQGNDYQEQHQNSNRKKSIGDNIFEDVDEMINLDEEKTDEERKLPSNIFALRKQLEPTLPFERLIICEQCRKVIKGSSVRALDKDWHIEHFRCATCKSSFGASTLNDIHYYPFQSNAYCPKCIRNAYENSEKEGQIIKPIRLAAKPSTMYNVVLRPESGESDSVESKEKKKNGKSCKKIFCILTCIICFILFVIIALIALRTFTSYVDFIPSILDLVDNDKNTTSI